MFAWIFENIATIIICIVLFAVVTAIIVSMVRGKKKGKSSCGCGCADCPMSGSCRSKGKTEIISENPLDDNDLRKAIDATGYTVISVDTEPYAKKDYSGAERFNSIPLQSGSHGYSCALFHCGSYQAHPL